MYSKTHRVHYSESETLSGNDMHRFFYLLRGGNVIQPENLSGNVFLKEVILKLRS